jgi:hypothetical protein
MIKDSYKQFLLERAGADKIKHSGRTLYAHLCGTHDLLQAWGNDEPVCAAGLFHSIYGTARFHHKTWSLSNRATIERLIGPKAEWLVCVFGMADRPKAFFSDAHSFSVDTLRALREIEAANLLEQGSYSRWMKQLQASDISDGAKQAIDRHLNARAA